MCQSLDEKEKLLLEAAEHLSLFHKEVSRITEQLPYTCDDAYLQLTKIRAMAIETKAALGRIDDEGIV